jgi:hypothetical protein
MLILNLKEVDANSDFSEQQSSIRGFLENHKIKVLNVAGPRASGWAEAYGLSRKILSPVFARYALV